MKKITLLSVLTAFYVAGFNSFAQNDDPVVMRLGKEEIKMSEFTNTFTKNNDLSKTTETDLRNYIELYVTFRLKYVEARDMELDTVAGLRTELAEYREQCAAKYLTDKEVSEKIFNEAIERMKWDVRASHILKRVLMDALPADTLAAYNAIMKLRTRILNGENFNDVAVKESDDNQARDAKTPGGAISQYGNKGELGYFTAFDMIYSFESGAYNTAVGAVSMPVRTELGYHLILVQDKRPALGKYKATQILIPFNKSPNLTPSEKGQDIDQVSKRVKSIYDAISKSEISFDDALRQYVEKDGGNGKLPLFGCNRFEGDFIKNLYGLKAGEISKPIQSSHGFHIVRIDEWEPVRTDEESHAAIRTRILQDLRSNKSMEAFIERVKRENDFKEIEDKKAKTTPVEDFYTALDSNILIGTFDKSMVKHLNRPMFVFTKKTYTQQDFAQYLENHPFTNVREVQIPVLVNFAYKRFIENTVVDYENSQLESKYPQFADLMKEYKEGIVLYELNERKIWKKAENDSVGLNDFYEKVKQTHLYPLRVKAEYFKAADEATAKKVYSLLKKETCIDKIMAKMNKKRTVLTMEDVVYWQGQNKQFDEVTNWKTLEDIVVEIRDNLKRSNESPIPISKTIYTLNTGNELLRIDEVLPPSPKPLKEVKGLVMSEYQNKLEEEWISSLYKNNEIWIDYTTILSLIKK